MLFSPQILVRTRPVLISSGLLTGAESDGTNALGTDPLDMASGWSNTNTTTTANDTTSPDGNVTAEFINESAVTNRHNVFKSSVSVTTNKTRTISIYAKMNGRRYLQIIQDNTSAIFDLQAGAVTDTTASGTASALTTSIQAAVNGFYKCTFQFFDTASSAGFLNYALSDVQDDSGTLISGSPSYLGVVGVGIWMWRPKLVVT